MEKINNNSKLEFTALKFNTMLWVLAVGVFILCAIFQISKYTSNTTQMLYWVIFIGSVYTFFAIFLFWKTTYSIAIEFTKEMFTLKNKTDNQSFSYHSYNIENYNLYNLPIKKMGLIFRINEAKNSTHWLVFENNSFYENIEILKTELQKKMLPKKNIFKDYIIKILFALPIILLITGILILLGGFLYIYFYL
ncbi:hypothetical protein [Chryseobacterium sp.]|uniref:hypothetical protein n=1 Tax=Chryseobacterium sp. TaxID=1871047 RepID=UPI00289DA51A|nr:hypothetical protein [Chryseobacterium sp.]